MATKTLLTIEQFDQLPFKEGILYELNEGEVVIMTEPMPRHDRVRDKIARPMGNFVEARNFGEVFCGNRVSAQPWDGAHPRRLVCSRGEDEGTGFGQARPGCTGAGD